MTSTPHDATETPADRLLRHACPDWRMGGGPFQPMHARTAERMLRAQPELADANVQTRIVCGDLDGVRRILDERPSAASEPGGPRQWPPLLYLCTGRLALPAFREHAVAIATALLDRGADPNAYYLGGNETIHYTALTCIAGEGEEDAPPHARRDELFDLLLERGAEPYDGQLVYNTNFHGRVLWWLKRVHARAIALGRDEDWRNPDWPMLDMGGYGCGARFLLDNAIRTGDLELAAWILSHGANPNAAPARDTRRPQRSLYQEAMRHGQTEIAALLVQHGATAADAKSDDDAFTGAAMRVDRERARTLLDRHPEYREQSEALLIAALHDHAAAAALLLDLGVSPEVVEPNPGKRRALHVAAHIGAARVAQLLVDRGATVDAIDATYNSTPLRWAMWGRQLETSRVLGRVSRDVWSLAGTGNIARLRELVESTPELAKAAEQSTPLFWLPDDEAVAAQIALLLLAHGADPRFRRPDGKTAADVARDRAMDDVAALMDRSVGQEIDGAHEL